MMLSAGLCSPHVIRSVLLINQWESNSYFRDPELTNEKRNVRSLLSPAMNMFVIIIWLKTADPPEHEDSLLWDISVGLHNKEPSEVRVLSVVLTRPDITGTQMWLSLALTGVQVRTNSGQYCPSHSSHSDTRLFLSALLSESQIFSGFRKFPPPATAGGWSDFLGLGRTQCEARVGTGAGAGAGCRILGKWNPDVRLDFIISINQHCQSGMLGRLTLSTPPVSESDIGQYPDESDRLNSQHSPSHKYFFLSRS